MHVAVLASGSKGNATFVEMDGIRILVDAGISTRRIKQELSALGENIEDLDGVFITHEHIDHVKGLTTMSKKYHIQLYSRPATFKAMSCYRELPQDCINPIIQRVQLGRVTVTAFHISHDVADPVGYIIQGSSRCIVATDIGMVDDTLLSMLEGAQVMVLEANHDVEMLRTGKYPPDLKRRIRGKWGHLSNEETAHIICSLKRRPKKLLLAHLSDANNLPRLALDTVQNALQKNSITDVEVYVTAQDNCTSVTF